MSNTSPLRYANASRHDQKIIIDFCIELLKNSKSVGIGTVLIAFEHIVEDGKKRELFSAHRRIRSSCRRHGRSEIDQLTAFQLLTALKHRNPLFMSKEILKRNHSINLKVCAKYAIRTLGSPADLTRLNAYKTSHDLRFKNAHSSKAYTGKHYINELNKYNLHSKTGYKMVADLGFGPRTYGL